MCDRKQLVEKYNEFKKAEYELNIARQNFKKCADISRNKPFEDIFGKDGMKGYMYVPPHKLYPELDWPEYRMISKKKSLKKIKKNKKSLKKKKNIRK